MKTCSRCIVLNLDKDSQAIFTEGLEGVPCEYLRTTQILLHIDKNNEAHFIHHSLPISWEGAYVFTRLHGRDQHFCGILYDYFTRHNIPSNDPINGSYKNSAGKISQMLKLALAGIRIPETIIFSERGFRSNFKYISEHIQYPLIYKTDGRRGVHVHYVESETSLKALIAQKAPDTLALVQPFIENAFDTRTIVAYGEVLGTIKRTRTHGYLNNISQGALPAPYTLTPDEHIVALRAAEVCGIDFGGIDMIHTEKGPVVLEVNKSPQVRGFESVHNIKVFSHIGASIRKRYIER